MHALLYSRLILKRCSRRKGNIQRRGGRGCCCCRRYFLSRIFFLITRRLAFSSTAIYYSCSCCLKSKMGVEIGDGVVSEAERDGMGERGRKLMRGFHCLLFTLCLFAFCLWQATMIRIRRRLMAVVTARAVVDVAAALSPFSVSVFLSSTAAASSSCQSFPPSAI